jgi:hypothetical protein
MKLIKTGQWYWREDELSFKQFHKLKRDDKEEYLFLLKGLPEDERRTTDLYLLNLYVKEEPKQIKFLEL